MFVENISTEASYALHGTRHTETATHAPSSTEELVMRTTRVSTVESRAGFTRWSNARFKRRTRRVPFGSCHIKDSRKGCRCLHNHPKSLKGNRCDRKERLLAIVNAADLPSLSECYSEASSFPPCRGGTTAFTIGWPLLMIPVQLSQRFCHSLLRSRSLFEEAKSYTAKKSKGSV